MKDEAMENEAKSCLKCGREIHEGTRRDICPKCLMEKGLELDVAVDMAEIQALNESPGRYSILGEHGKGGMGRVLLVHDEHLGRDIALKELAPDLGDDPTPSPAPHSKEMAARFLREAKITGQLEHPSITPVHEIGRREDGTLYYTMKFVRGRTLSEAIQGAKDFEERLKLLPHFVDLCNAISYAHSRGVLHRDIKPSNVMVGDYGETVLIDWGLAKSKKGMKSTAPVSTAERDNYGEKALIDGGRAKSTDPVSPAEQKTVISGRATANDDDSTKTQYGQAMGTPAYMPPEQATGDLDHIDERSDVYSLGAVLYEILTAQPPHEGEQAQEVIRKVLTQEPRPAQKVQKGVSREISRICQQAMHKSPEKRIATARELARRLERMSQERVFLSPLRPYMTDLVPQLKALSKQQRKDVTEEAGLRLWKNWRLTFRLAILNCLLLFYAIGLSAYIFMMPPAQESLLNAHLQMDTEISSLKMFLRRQTEDQNIPDSLFARGIRASDSIATTQEGLQRYFRSIQLGSSLLFIAGFFLSINTLAQITKSSLAPYVREVAAELESRGRIDRNERAGRRTALFQGLSALLGLGCGSLVGLATHHYVAFEYASRGVTSIIGMMIGAGLSSIAFYLYTVQPWKQMQEK